MDIYYVVCKKSVPKRKLTEESKKRGFGLCSNRCSRIYNNYIGPTITNRLGKKQFDTNQHYNPKLAPWNKIKK